MAFQNTAPVSNPDTWKAQGFLNLYLPAKDGGKRRKLGAIPLKDSKPAEKILMAWLAEDPAGNSAKILSKLIIEYQSATPADTAGFDLA